MISDSYPHKLPYSAEVNQHLWPEKKKITAVQKESFYLNKGVLDYYF